MAGERLRTLTRGTKSSVEKRVRSMDERGQTHTATKRRRSKRKIESTSMLNREEESEAEVRREDQENINRFGRLNARLHEVRAEKEDLRKRMEGAEDASTELMMGSGEKVMLMLGETFLESSEDDATEHLEAEVEKYQERLELLDAEEADISEQQAVLKRTLYARFGKSIQLET